jgi:hypothetical protein
MAIRAAHYFQKGYTYWQFELPRNYIYKSKQACN